MSQFPPVINIPVYTSGTVYTWNRKPDDNITFSHFRKIKIGRWVRLSGGLVYHPSVNCLLGQTHLQMGQINKWVAIHPSRQTHAHIYTQCHMTM